MTLPIANAETPLAHESQITHEDLHQKLNSLMVLHEVPEEHTNYYELQRYEGIKGVSQDEVDNYYPEKASDEHRPSWLAVDSNEKSQVLRQIKGLLTESLTEAHVEAQSLTWSTRAAALVDKAKDMPESVERTNALLASVVSSQFSPNAADKAAFIGHVYDAGLQQEVADACKQSPLSLSLKEEPRVIPGRDGDPDVTVFHRTHHRLADFATAFEADPKHVGVYVENVQRLAEHRKKTEELPSSKKLGKTLIEGYERGETPDEALEEQVITVSLSGEKVQGSILDIYKVERFALQQVFMQEQMKDVLEDIEAGTPALLRAIIDRQSQPSNVVSPGDIMHNATFDKVLLDRLSRLEEDTIESFQELSQRANELFSLEGVDVSQRHLLTREQHVALRFKEVTAVLEAHDSIARYLDIQDYRERREKEALSQFAENITVGDLDLSIGTIASDGAAAPNLAIAVVGNIVRAAKKNKSLHATPGELHNLAQKDRRRLLALGTNQFSDFINVEVDASMHESPSNPDEHLKLVRKPDGELAILNDFPLPNREGADVYAAVIMGCPALRLVHPDRAMLKYIEKVAAIGTSNYMDHVLAAIIRAAHERQLFSVESIELERGMWQNLQPVTLPYANTNTLID